MIEIGTFWRPTTECKYYTGEGIIEIIPLDEYWTKEGASIQYRQINNGKIGGYSFQNNFLNDFEPLTNQQKLELL